ncbi:response regulator [Roseomonas chloroacetimidivorans]|uniref:response regulator n=1 Tax=Roseomonas chloroacetimidivorans TaxID=1766656 RepID=UPI003C714EC9
MSVILLVKGDKALREILAKTLKNARIRVLKAEDLPAALALLSSTPDCTALIGDVDFSDPVNGLGAAERVREMDLDLAFVTISGTSEHWLKRRGTSWERSVTKTFEPGELVEALRELGSPDPDAR